MGEDEEEEDFFDELDLVLLEEREVDEELEVVDEELEVVDSGGIDEVDDSGAASGVPESLAFSATSTPPAMATRAISTISPEMIHLPALLPPLGGRVCREKSSEYEYGSG